MRCTFNVIRSQECKACYVDFVRWAALCILLLWTCTAVISLATLIPVKGYFCEIFEGTGVNYSEVVPFVNFQTLPPGRAVSWDRHTAQALVVSLHRAAQLASDLALKTKTSMTNLMQ
jgi:hypothetical protein